MKKAKDEVVQILAIDDNPDMLSVYESMFKHERHYKVDLIDNAMKALRKLGDKHYDVIILDIIMEPLTGESFFVYLRGNKETMHIPVIVVSVLEPHMLEAIKKVNNAIILQKPVRKVDLIDAINRSLVS